MQFISNNILTFAFVLPLLGAAIVALMPKRATTEARVISLAFSLATSLIAVVVITMLQNTGEFQFTQAARWIPQLGIAYRVGVDGTSALLVLMVAAATAATIAASTPTYNDKAFFALVLVVEGAMIGAYVALDVFLFFVCSELLLIPFFFIIGMGESGTSRRSTITYAVITLLGSALLLVAMTATSLQNGGSFDLIAWYAKAKASGTQVWLFAAFALAFMIKMAVVPIHAWIVDASADAPSGGSALLLALLPPMGTYGLFRYAIPLFPQASDYALAAMMAIAVTSIIYAGLNALVQDNARRLVAFAAIVSSGMMLLGIFAFEQNAAQGAAIQMFNHGITFSALALLLGMIEARTGTSDLREFSGLAQAMPFAATYMIAIAACAAGLPFLSTFVGWFLILLGSFQTQTTSAGIATAGLAIVCAYTFRFTKRAFFGNLKVPKPGFVSDMDAREVACISVLIAIILAIGVWPKPWLGKTTRSTDAFLALSERGIARRKAVKPSVKQPKPKLTPLKAPPSQLPRLRVEETPSPPVIEHQRVTLPPLPEGAGEDEF